MEEDEGLEDLENAEEVRAPLCLSGRSIGVLGVLLAPWGSGDRRS